MYKSIKLINYALELYNPDFNYYFDNWCIDNGMKLDLNKCSVLTLSYIKNTLQK